MPRRRRRSGSGGKLARAAKHCKGTKGQMKFRKCIKTYFKRN